MKWNHSKIHETFIKYVYSGYIMVIEDGEDKMNVIANGKITGILDHKVISGRTTTKVAVDQEHLGMRCVRLQTELGVDSVGKKVHVKDLYDPSGKPESQEIILAGDYMKKLYN